MLFIKTALRKSSWAEARQRQVHLTNGRLFVNYNYLGYGYGPGWAEMIRNAYEVDPMICPKCGGRMKAVAFITEVAVVDRIIDHLKLTFVAAKPLPSHVFEQVALPTAEESGEYF